MGPLSGSHIRAIVRNTLVLGPIDFANVAGKYA